MDTFSVISRFSVIRIQLYGNSDFENYGEYEYVDFFKGH